MSQTQAVACLAVLTSGACANAAILPDFSGHHRAAMEIDFNNDASLSFAVFDRSGVGGDVFGTGIPDFDELFIPGDNNTNAFDVAGRYLYLYQYVNDGQFNEITDLAIDAYGLTSWGHWQLGFADADGPVAPQNPLGTNGTNFSLAAPAILGVDDGRLIRFSNPTPRDKEPASLLYEDGSIRVGFGLEAGNRTTVFGFTSNRAPVVRNFTLDECPDDKVCGGFVSPPPGRPEAYVDVNPRATYLRAASELAPGPADPGVIDLSSVIPNTPIQAGDWVLLQRVGDFIASDAACAHRGDCAPDVFPVLHPERPATLRNMFGIFSSSGDYYQDPEALRGAKETPIDPSNPIFSRVHDAVPGTFGELEGTVVPIDTDTSRFPGDQIGDPFENGTKFQLTDLEQDFVIDIQGDLENPTPYLVRVPEGATHLFVSAGDGQFFDNRLVESKDLKPEDTDPYGVFGLRLAVVEPGRLVGDYNLDGVVDTADYTVWHDQLGGVGLSLEADGDADGRVTEADLMVWKQNYGRVLDAGATRHRIPEPTASVLTVLVLLGTAGSLVATRSDMSVAR